MPRKKKSKTVSSSKILNYIAWVLALVALVLSSAISGYYFGYENAQEDMQKKVQNEKQKRLATLKKLEKLKPKKEKKSVNKQLKEVLKKETTRYISASHELDDNRLAKPPARVKREPKRVSSSRPKLAIIIDDIGAKSHVKAVKSLQLPLTMSFLPPSKARPNSAKLAAKENIYMVHLPMEAQSFSAEEPDTLRVEDSQKKIKEKIEEIKRLFPRVRYLNNHTGSKFTSSEVAMNRLIYALNLQNINFIDSRTTAETKAPKVLEKFGLSYVARDVFLDHHMDKKSVVEQIKRAVKIAKNHGTAIAIGHPHKNTIAALRESKYLFKDVELVYINKLH